MNLPRSPLTAASLLLLLVCLAGCERDVITSDYFPLRDGNSWTYRSLNAKHLKHLGDGGTIQLETSPADSAPSPDKAEIIGAGQTRDASAAKRKSEPSAEDQAGSDASIARRIELKLKERITDLTYRAELDGYEQVWSKESGYVGFQNASGRHYWLILPPHTGYRWIVTDSDGENLYYEIEGHFGLKTPAGLFSHCALVRQESRDRRVLYKYWFADGVGLVRRSKYYGDQEIYRQELLEYEVKPSTAAGRREEQREIDIAMKGVGRGKEFMKKTSEKDLNGDW